MARLPRDRKALPDHSVRGCLRNGPTGGLRARVDGCRGAPREHIREKSVTETQRPVRRRPGEGGSLGGGRGRTRRAGASAEAGASLPAPPQDTPEYSSNKLPGLLRGVPDVLLQHPFLVGRERPPVGPTGIGREKEEMHAGLGLVGIKSDRSNLEPSGLPAGGFVDALCHFHDRLEPFGYGEKAAEPSDSTARLQTPILDRHHQGDGGLWIDNVE